jgi:hypothetical protein
MVVGPLTRGGCQGTTTATILGGADCPDADDEGEVRWPAPQNHPTSLSTLSSPSQPRPNGVSTAPKYFLNRVELRESRHRVPPAEGGTPESVDRFFENGVLEFAPAGYDQSLDSHELPATFPYFVELRGPVARVGAHAADQFEPVAPTHAIGARVAAEARRAMMWPSTTVRRAARRPAQKRTHSQSISSTFVRDGTLIGRRRGGRP